MNYQELEKVLQGPLTYTNTSDKKLIEHFQEKFKMTPREYKKDFKEKEVIYQMDEESEE